MLYYLSKTQKYLLSSHLPLADKFPFTETLLKATDSSPPGLAQCGSLARSTGTMGPLTSSLSNPGPVSSPEAAPLMVGRHSTSEWWAGPHFAEGARSPGTSPDPLPPGLPLASRPLLCHLLAGSCRPFHPQTDLFLSFRQGRTTQVSQTLQNDSRFSLPLCPSSSLPHPRLRWCPGW